MPSAVRRPRQPLTQRRQNVDWLCDEIEALSTWDIAASNQKEFMADFGIDRPISIVLIMNVGLAGAIVFTNRHTVV